MPALLRNKKAHLNYEILETFEAGIELLGTEVKSLRVLHGSLEGAHAIIRGKETYIVGMYIPPYQEKNAPRGYDPYRTRKLLLTKKEIRELGQRGEQKGLTIVPISLYTKKRKVKVELAVARGKKKFDKRETIKKKYAQRDVEREIKARFK